MRRGHAILLAVALVVALLAGVALFGPYGRQVRSTLTHPVGSPTHTEPLTPFAPGKEPATRVAVAGDVGEPGGRAAKTGEAIARAGRDRQYDALLLLGDNVYPNGDPARLEERVFRPFAPVLSTGAELLAILGNHDVKANHADAQMRALGMPGRWWSRRVGEMLIVGLDSNEPDNPVQRAWLARTLAASDAPWKVVALHHPPYSSGYQGSDKAARQSFSPLFERYGVQLVLSGHEHDYERTKPIDGVTYVVSGAGSNTRRTGRSSFTAKAVSWHHFVDLAVFPDHLLVRAVNQKDRVFDEFVIRLPADELAAAA